MTTDLKKTLVDSVTMERLHSRAVTALEMAAGTTDKNLRKCYLQDALTWMTKALQCEEWYAEKK